MRIACVPASPISQTGCSPVDLARLLCTASRWQHRCAAASSTSLNLRRRYSLTATIENDDARADEFCAVTENQAGFNGFNDGEEAKPVIDRFGNPTVSPGNVAKMNISMPIRHGVFVACVSALADEHECFARSKMVSCIPAALDPDGRFASQLCYPARVGTYAVLLEQGQRASPATLLGDLLRLAVPSKKKRVDRRQRDRRPS
jgi:hypothetical protein